MEELSFLSV